MTTQTGRLLATCLSIGLAIGMISPAANAEPTGPGAPDGTSLSSRASGPPQDKFFRPSKIRIEDMGIHSYQNKPQLPSRTIRFACAPTWAQIQPTRDTWDWTELDRRVEEVNEWGFSDILFTFCEAPTWAAPKTFGSPDDLADWETFLRAIATRYKGKIQHWEVWNEVSSADFYQGTPERMGEMTAIADRVIHEVDPAATVITPSVQTHQPGWVRQFLPRYLEWMRSNGWPADALGLHTYTKLDPYARPREIRYMQKIFADYNPPARMRFWDTEVNTEAKPGPKGQAAILARVFLDSWRLGIDRTYWFMWTAEKDPSLGIEMRWQYPAMKAWGGLAFWLKGARLKGCTENKTRVLCRFGSRGKTTRVAYAVKGSYKQPVKAGTLSCSVYPGGCRTSKKKTRIRVGIVPVIFGG